jgi:hypothetical protein
VLIDNEYRVLLDNARHGPDAIVLAGDPAAPETAPAAPWKSFHVTTYLDVNFPTQSVDLYQFQIRGFFRVHPLLEVTSFGRHKRVFPFPVTHCENIRDDDHGNEIGRLHGGALAGGKGAPGTPAPHKGDKDKNGGRGSDALVAGGAVHAVPRAGAAADEGTGLLNAGNVAVAAGALLTALGVPAAFWLRRRRSAE